MVTTVSMLSVSTNQMDERFEKMHIFLLFCKCGKVRINSKASGRAGKPVMITSQ